MALEKQGGGGFKRKWYKIENKGVRETRLRG